MEIGNVVKKLEKTKEALDNLWIAFSNQEDALLWNRDGNILETENYKQAWYVIGLIHEINDKLKQLRIKLYKWDKDNE